MPFTWMLIILVDGRDGNGGDGNVAVIEESNTTGHNCKHCDRDLCVCAYATTKTCTKRNSVTLYRRELTELFTFPVQTGKCDLDSTAASLARTFAPITYYI